ncbi:2-deoxy-scyllo-inosose synthase [Paludibacterium paludis]|uniref:3-dehydroquinate synthase n=1 Tax=Paludibacterium paludis TaxID=1225769 RepID=A0A918UBS8_9NEIS|nr:2-deoxy-scyllo-inosose synthase [Paludibacterium paludis]GGY24613.1 3-dehydroquinate synthase [Paludibacterium paludis]
MNALDHQSEHRPGSGGHLPPRAAEQWARDQDARGNGEPMQRIDLSFEDVAYPFWIGSRCTGEIAAHLDAMAASSLHIVTDRNVGALHAGTLAGHLRDVAPVSVWTLPEGEMTKSLGTLERLACQLLDAGADRKSVVIAMGGGVVGNIAGLLAAVLYRGIRLVHVPTTLMAMSDSVISLKQAVNMPQGKNLVGCFHTPSAVFADTAYLMTLPAEHLRSGLCEIIKNVLTIDADRLSFLSATLDPSARYDETTLVRMVEAGVVAKQRVMIDDKREKGRAIVFEYGHTVGHAIELACGGRLSHGEAVGLGMVVAAEVAHELGLLPGEVRDLHYRLLRRNGVAIRAPEGLTPEAVMTALRSDNKRGYVRAGAGEIPMILLRGLGEPLWGNGEQPLTLVDADLVGAMLRRHLFQLEPSHSMQEFPCLS